MKLATLKDGTRDGQLAVVSRDLKSAVLADGIAPTLQSVLDDWAFIAPQLEALSDKLNAGKATHAFEFNVDQCMAPLPRAYQWADGSAYLSHVERVRLARGAAMPSEVTTEPLMYQGCSDGWLGPHDAVPLFDESWGLDLEGEVAVIVDDVPAATSPTDALGRIRLLLLVNDWSLRNLIPSEVAKGFGFVQSKPASSCAPVAVTVDELGAHWSHGRLHLPLRSLVNGRLIGNPDAGSEMAFHFGVLIAHLCKTRAAVAGTVIGGGTVSNRSPDAGYACLIEKRAVEIMQGGCPTTPFLTYGDEVVLDIQLPSGGSVFGEIRQKINRLSGGGSQRKDVEMLHAVQSMI